MQEIQKAESISIVPKFYNNQRVVTFKDIESVHKKENGIAKRNFNRNKKHFILDEDYFEITKKELRVNLTPNSKTERGNPNLKVILLTESGYLMIVKSFTDDLSWEVQRQLVNNYFRVQEQAKALPQLRKNQPSWFKRNVERMNQICGQNNWELKFLIHKILKEIYDIYDINSVKKLYFNIYEKMPEYPIDVVDLNPTIEKVANQYLEYLENNV